MLPFDVMNHLIKTYGYKSYLEIGVQRGKTLRKVKCDRKIGVDPHPLCPVDYRTTSDEFFKINNDKFDIIFIDGLHLSEQVVKDFINSTKILNEGGCILFDDLLPATEISQMRNSCFGSWHGDCWKAFVHLRFTYGNEWSFRTIDIPPGVGIAMKNGPLETNLTEEILDNYIDLSWDSFCKNRNEWMNVISVDKFLSTYSH